jgi:hypothetical protein
MAVGKRRIHLLTKFISGHSKDEQLEVTMNTPEEIKQAESNLLRRRHRQSKEGKREIRHLDGERERRYRKRDR